MNSTVITAKNTIRTTAFTIIIKRECATTTIAAIRSMTQGAVPPAAVVLAAVPPIMDPPATVPPNTVPPDMEGQDMVPLPPHAIVADHVVNNSIRNDAACCEQRHFFMHKPAGRGCCFLKQADLRVKCPPFACPAAMCEERHLYFCIRASHRCRSR